MAQYSRQNWAGPQAPKGAQDTAASRAAQLEDSTLRFRREVLGEDVGGPGPAKAQGNLVNKGSSNVKSAASTTKYRNGNKYSNGNKYGNSKASQASRAVEYQNTRTIHNSTETNVGSQRGPRSPWEDEHGNEMQYHTNIKPWEIWGTSQEEEEERKAREEKKKAEEEERKAQEAKMNAQADGQADAPDPLDKWIACLLPPGTRFEGSDMLNRMFEKQFKPKEKPRYTRSGLPMARMLATDSSRSLPTSSVSSESIVVSETGVGSSSKVPTIRDIRSSIGPELEHTLWVGADGKWQKAWIDVEEDVERAWTHVRPDFVKSFVINWLARDCTDGVEADFLKRKVSQHWLSDVDTTTGSLMDPVYYPYTMRDISYDMDPATAERQQTWTSNLLLMRELNHIKHTQSSGFGPRRLAATAHAKRQAPVNPNTPKVPCHLRPANEADMYGAMEIYNWEVAHGTQALDIEPLGQWDFMNILKTCEQGNLPFIVAISGPSTYLPFTAHTGRNYMGEKLQQEPQQPGVVCGKVLAFGFFAVYDTGLAGGLNSTGRLSVKAHVYVDNDYRRNGIGRAVLDKLMSLASRSHAPKGGYEWVSRAQNPVYVNPDVSPRLYHRVFVEVLCKEEGDTEKEWRDRFLTTQFKFKQVGKPLEDSHRAPGEGRRGDWMHKVTYQFDCQAKGFLLAE